MIRCELVIETDAYTLGAEDGQAARRALVSMIRGVADRLEQSNSDSIGAELADDVTGTSIGYFRARFSGPHIGEASHG